VESWGGLTVDATLKLPVAQLIATEGTEATELEIDRTDTGEDLRAGLWLRRAEDF